MKDLKMASIALEQWLEEAENFGIPQFAGSQQFNFSQPVEKTTKSQVL
jgi:hypothetical protein